MAGGVGGELPTELLWQRLCGGDRSALEPLYRREAARVYRYALALTGNAAWAADATQEAFVALTLRPRGFDPERGALGAYLAGVARHALAARWRELARETSLEAREERPEGEAADAGEAGKALWRDDDELRSPAAPAAAQGPEAMLVRRQQLAALWSALAALPPALREAVVLVDLQEHPYAEAAQVAGIELNTLRTRLHRGRARLAALLAGPGADRGTSR
jgi:RNA polymerase sigma-70 factor (ECF subfamily)